MIVIFHIDDYRVVYYTIIMAVYYTDIIYILYQIMAHYIAIVLDGSNPFLRCSS